MTPLTLVCVNDLGHVRCSGSLRDSGHELTCCRCGTCYSSINGVPVIMPGDAGNSHAGSRAFYATYMGSKHQSLEDFRRWAQFSGYQQGLISAIKSLANAMRITGPCLEVGCSGGLLAGVLPDYVGLDFSLQTLLVEGWEKYRRVNADAARLPFVDKSFELIVSISTLEHVAQAGEALLEMDRVLLPGGILFLHPAWHCTSYNNELIPIRPYSSLNTRQKLTKALLPVLSSKVFRALVRIPHRAYRRALCPVGQRVRLKPLNPNYGAEELADQDACVSIDPHEVIRFFLARGYRCLSHPSILSQLIAGGHAVVLQKIKSTSDTPANDSQAINTR